MPELNALFNNIHATDKSTVNDKVLNFSCLNDTAAKAFLYLKTRGP